MEKKLIGLVLIALLAGFGGYGLGHLVSVLLYKSPVRARAPVDITSAKATVWRTTPEGVFWVSLTFTVRNNGEGMEFLVPHLIVKEVNGSSLIIQSYSTAIFPHENATMEVKEYGTKKLYNLLIEVWTYDGDAASAYVEKPK